MTTKSDIQTEITNKLLAAMENADEWVSPFARLANSGFPTNVSSKKPYSGINILALWCEQHEHGYTSAEWGTYKQWKTAGFQVQKGETATNIIFFKSIEKTNKATGEKEAFPLLRGYRVFNREQTNAPGIEIPAPAHSETVSDEIIDFIDNTGAAVGYKDQTRAYYSPAQDAINIPYIESMKSANQWTLTMLHELAHWTGHKTRLNRLDEKGPAKVGYAFEELIAEISAAFTAASLGIAIDSNVENHAAYLNSWLNAMRGDSGFIFKAAAAASKATSFLTNLQAHEKAA